MAIHGGPYADLVTWLEDHAVPFEVHEHPLSYTASATAHAEGVSERSFAKVVGIGLPNGGRMLAVVHAADQVDLVRLATTLRIEWVTVLSESEMAAILPDCEAGTVPPIPELARVPVIADEAVRADPWISFHAGSHQSAVRVERAAWDRAAGIQYGTFASTAGRAST